MHVGHSAEAKKRPGKRKGGLDCPDSGGTGDSMHRMREREISSGIYDARRTGKISSHERSSLPETRFGMRRSVAGIIGGVTMPRSQLGELIQCVIESLLSRKKVSRSKSTGQTVKLRLAKRPGG